MGQLRRPVPTNLTCPRACSACCGAARARHARAARRPRRHAGAGARRRGWASGDPGAHPAGHRPGFDGLHRAHRPRHPALRGGRGAHHADRRGQPHDSGAPRPRQRTGPVRAAHRGLRPHPPALARPPHRGATGALVARVTSDVETLSQFFSWGGIMWLVNGAVIVAVAVTMAIYDWRLAAIAIAVVAPLVLVLRTLQPRMLRAYEKLRADYGDVMAAVSEAVTGAAVIRAFGMQQRAIEKVDERIREHRRSWVRAGTLSALLFPSGEVFAVFTVSAVVAAGVWLGPGSGLSAGRLVAFLFLVNLFLDPVAEFTEIIEQTQTAVAGWRRVLDVLDTPVDVPEPSRLPGGAPAGYATDDHRRACLVRVRGRTPGAPRHRRDVPGRQDDGAGRSDRFGEVDAGEAARAARRPERRPHPRARRRSAGCRAGAPAQPHRAGSAGDVPVRHDDRGQRRLRQPGGGRRRHPARLHRARPRRLARRPAGWARHARRRAGRAPLGRGAPAGRAGPRLRGEPDVPPARRGHLGGRPRHRDPPGRGRSSRWLTVGPRSRSRTGSRPPSEPTSWSCSRAARWSSKATTASCWRRAVPTPRSTARGWMRQRPAR